MLAPGAMTTVRRLRVAWLVTALLFVSTRGVLELAEQLGAALVAAVSHADGDLVRAADMGDGSDRGQDEGCDGGCPDHCPDGPFRVCQCCAPAVAMTAQAPRLAPCLAHPTGTAPEVSPGAEFPGFVEPPFRPPLA